jgi:hypothetical protein
MKRQTAAMRLLIALFCVAFGAQVRAQQQEGDAPRFNPERVPAEGAKEQDFVPRGWKIGALTDGDLNGDGLPDRVRQLVPEDYDGSGIAAAPEAQALLILLSAEGGKLRRAGLATRLLVPIVPQYILDMSIKKGVLVVNQNFGMTDVADLTHRFRYDPATGRFLLIGKDTFSYHRPQGPLWPATRISENYLTGVRLTSTERWLKDGTSRPTPPKREQIGRARVALEEVDEDPDN